MSTDRLQGGLLMGSAHWDWTKRPSGIWDRRPEGLAEPNAVFPPIQCMVVNAIGERVEGVVAVDFDRDLVLIRVINEVDGKRTCPLDLNTGFPLAQWVHVPGVSVRPMPIELLQEQERRALARKGYKREADGTISTGHVKEAE